MKKYNNQELDLSYLDQKLTLYGWVNKRRDMGGVIFVDLRDRSGFVQVVFNREFLTTDFELAETLRNEFCIKVTGTLKKRDDDKINPNIKTGEIELMVDHLEILSESEVLPFNVYEDSEVNETTALKYRFLDLRKDKLKQTLKTRHEICKSTRAYFDNAGFYEVETPILCKSTPEGARDYIVPSRINKGSFYALPQSPQIFKQLLMVGGIEKYYQIARCFRDEDLRADRQPEFTQIDVEMSFVEQEDIINTFEGLLKTVVKDIKGIELDNFPRMPFLEAMDRYGSDKPDTRFEMELINLTDILKDTNMNVFRSVIEAGGIAKCLIVKNNSDKYSRSDVEHLTTFVKMYGAKGLAWLKYNDNEYSGAIAKNLEPEKLEELKNKFNVENNDLILIVADKQKIVHDSLGALRLKLGRELGLIDKSKLNFLWVVDFPLFEYSEADNRYKSTHHPFTMPESLEAMKDPANCKSFAYDVVLNGYELGSGSIRIHNPKMQKQVFEALGLTDKDIQAKFGFFIDAFNYGTPPHGGMAIGLERLTMLLSDTENIKDVVAFPKTQSASDIMSEAPSEVSVEQLNELGLKLNDKEEDNE